MYLGVAQFEVSDGTTVEVPRAGVTLFVGPNNSGKSQALKDLIAGGQSGPSYTGKTVGHIELLKEGTAEELMAWISQNTPSVIRSGVPYHFLPAGLEGPLDQLHIDWENRPRVIFDLFAYYADATSRLNAGNAVEVANLTQRAATLPLQRAFLDGRIEEALDQASRDAFGIGI